MALQVSTIIYATCESSSQIDQLNMWPVRVKSSHKIFNRSFLFKILSYTMKELIKLYSSSMVIYFRIDEAPDVIDESVRVSKTDFHEKLQ